MQLNPAEISELIKSRIQGLSSDADIRNQGTVVSVTDGIVRVHGLSDVMQGEMLEFPATAAGVATFGLALNLERDSVGAVILGEYGHFQNAACTFDCVAFGDVLVLTQNHSTDRVALQVQSQTEGGNTSGRSGELKHLALHHV